MALKTNPFTKLQYINPKVRTELIWIEQRLEFLNNIKMENEMKQADGEDLTPVNAKSLRTGVFIVIACFIFGVSLIVWIADLLFTIS